MTISVLKAAIDLGYVLFIVELYTKTRESRGNS